MVKWEIKSQPRVIFGVFVFILGVFGGLIAAGPMGLPGFFVGFIFAFIGFLIMRSGTYRVPSK